MPICSSIAICAFAVVGKIFAPTQDLMKKLVRLPHWSVGRHPYCAGQLGSSKNDPSIFLTDRPLLINAIKVPAPDSFK
ncbi:hypothetical protein AVEN_155515-1 [Araneus ventricosus]|uniref:Uncharacterized protein n=1 Tax=Araneus ventricosus TaxID=182803 RepID=A0A4Y2VX20_ARAVE|nr:hypothetical protein AVEN_155515-1 [Araneus ventricosus]